MKIHIAPTELETKECIAVKIDGFSAEFPVLMRKIPDRVFLVVPLHRKDWKEFV